MEKAHDQAKASAREGAAKPNGTAKTARPNKVPEWAEDMEHTLRRLVRAKEARRSKNPGLYK